MCETISTAWVFKLQIKQSRPLTYMRPHFNNTGVETQEASIPTTKDKTKRDFKAIYRRGIASS